MKVLISGGGTGGHIFPAIAIADAVKRRDPQAEILFVGAQGRMEMERVPKAGYDIVGLPVAGFDRKRLWRNFAVIVRLMRSMLKARKVLRDFKPDVAVGVGGYASGPMLKAAQRAGVPTLLQEQNSYPGVTNKILGAKAKAICVAYEGTERFFPQDKITLTGNPVRAALLESALSQRQAKEALGFDPDKKLIVVTGGSLGAKTLNESIFPVVDMFKKQGVSLLWQCGKYYADLYVGTDKGNPDLQIVPFISDMATVYRAADLMVARAGAGTISELQLLGKASVLVPSPNVAEDHQRKNAMALVEREAAVMVPDSEAREKLPDTIMTLIADDRRCAALSRNISQMALRDSDEKIVDKLYEIISL